jgi:hypothetical protein
MVGSRSSDCLRGAVPVGGSQSVAQPGGDVLQLGVIQ